MTQMHPPTLNYRGPQIAPPGQSLQGVWRDGNVIVLAKGAQLPVCCVKCGQPAAPQPLLKTLYWHEPWLYALILAGVLLYAILAMALRKSVVLYVPLCEAHRASRGKGILVGTLVLVAGALLGLWGAFASAVAGPDGDYSLWIILGAVALIAGIALLVVASRTLWPTRIDDSHAWIKGAQEPFLAMLPPVQGYPCYRSSDASNCSSRGSESE